MMIVAANKIEEEAVHSSAVSSGSNIVTATGLSKNSNSADSYAPKAPTRLLLSGSVSERKFAHQWSLWKILINPSVPPFNGEVNRYTVEER